MFFENLYQTELLPLLSDKTKAKIEVTGEG